MSAQNLPPRAASLSLSNLTDDIYGYIYRTTNMLTGKSYVGQHRYRAGEPWRSYLGSGVLIVAAVRRYGRESFAKDLLATARSSSELDAAEVLWISRERARGAAEYNISAGGDSFTPHDQSDRVRELWLDEAYRSRQRESRVGFWSSIEARSKQSLRVRAVWSDPDYRRERLALIATDSYRAKVSQSTSRTKQTDRIGYSLRYTLRSHEKSHLPEDNRQSCPFCVKNGWAEMPSVEQIRNALEGISARRIGLSRRDRGRLIDLARRFELNSEALVAYLLSSSP